MNVKVLRGRRPRSFYVHFFLVAQKMLPRHQLRRLCRMAKEEKNKMLNEDEKLTADEVSLILRPLVDELMKRYPIERVNEIVKEAVRRAGFNPQLEKIEPAITATMAAIHSGVNRSLINDAFR